MRSVLELSVITGIAPQAIEALDADRFATLVDVVNESRK